jgi:BASS family bile acid:Na+ symporter
MSQGVVDVAIPVVTFLLMVVVGLDLTAGEFHRVRRRPLVLLTGLLAPIVVLPPLAWGLVILSSPSPAVATGLLIMSACPIGGISNVYSLLARADTALSVTLTTLSCLLAAVTIPMISGGLSFLFGYEMALTAPGRLLVVQLMLMLAGPVLLGMFIRARWPGVASRHHAALLRVAFTLVGLLVAVVIWSQFDQFLRELTGIVPRALVFMLLSLGAGALAGVLVRADRTESVTLALEFGTRNVAVATAIAVTMLGRIDFAVFGATYFLAELPLMLVLTIALRRKARM